MDFENRKLDVIFICGPKTDEGNLIIMYNIYIFFFFDQREMAITYDVIKKHRF